MGDNFGGATVCLGNSFVGQHGIMGGQLVWLGGGGATTGLGDNVVEGQLRRQRKGQLGTA